MSEQARRLVLVEWVDAFGCSSDWQPVSDISDPGHMTCRSVGWLLVDGEHSKVVCPHMHDANAAIGAVESGCGEMTIPSHAVISMVDLLPRPSMP